MVTNTDTHDLQQYEQGEENWEHTSDMGKLEKIIDVKRQRAPDASQETPYTNTLFFDLSTGDVYVGDGNSWGDPVWNFEDIGSGGSGGDPSSVSGIDDTRNHAGPLIQGEYHDLPALEGTTWGIAFSAPDGQTIDSCVLDVDPSTSTRDVLEVEFYQVDALDPNGITTPADPVDTVTTPSLSGSPERVDLGFTVPSDDGYSEYCLAINHVTDSDGGFLAPRYAHEWGGWDDYSDPGFDLLQGGRLNDPTNSEYPDLHFYFFDIAYGPAESSVTSPWSHDVEEIYMRPTDPTEQYDDVSPRSVWFDTS